MEGKWTNISTSSTVDSDEDFVTPSIIMQTAATTSNVLLSLDLSWSSSDRSTMFYVILHFSEIQNISSTAFREFSIYSEGSLVSNSTVPSKLSAKSAAFTDNGYTEHNLSLKATLMSTLPPLLNAVELYIITPSTGILTNDTDGKFHPRLPSAFFTILL
jgi:Malectin-like domain